MSRRQSFRDVGSVILESLPLAVPGSGPDAPPRKCLADCTMRLGLAPPAESDDPRAVFDVAHLRARLRAVAASRPRATWEALARDLALVLLAEDRVHEAVVALSAPADASKPDDSARWRIVYRRVQSRSEPPFAPSALRRRTFFMQLGGGLLKGWARLFHAVFPKRRWTLPAVSPAAPGSPPAPADSPIPRIVWQTNFTDRCTLPLWFNYRRNRRLSRDFEHRYVSTEAREAYLRAHAPSRVLRAYLRLEDGAAQADLWRVFALWREGGVYLDFDASLVQPLSRILAGREQVLLWNRKRFTNYFMATVPGNPLFERFLETIVSNVEAHGGGSAPTIFHTTGPGALEPVVDTLPDPDYVPHRACCIQGAFSNEHFQYADRPGTKWTHKRTFIRSLP